MADKMIILFQCVTISERIFYSEHVNKTNHEDILIFLNDIVYCKTRRMTARARYDKVERDRTSDCSKRAYLFIVTSVYKQIQGRTGAGCSSQCLHVRDCEYEPLAN